MKTTTIYKVCVPSMFAWPVNNVTLKTFFSKGAAEKYIDEYPNALVKPFLFISMENVEYTETD